MRKNNMNDAAQFTSTSEAEETAMEMEAKMKRAKIGLALAAAATAISIIGVAAGASGNILEMFPFIGMALGIVSYIVGGGFGTALKVLKKVAFWGWFILPFPYDLVTGMTTMVLGLIAFIMLPIVFVAISYHHMSSDYRDAMDYLDANQPV